MKNFKFSAYHAHCGVNIGAAGRKHAFPRFPRIYAPWTPLLLNEPTRYTGPTMVRCGSEEYLIRYPAICLQCTLTRRQGLNLASKLKKYLMRKLCLVLRTVRVFTGTRTYSYKSGSSNVEFFSLLGILCASAADIKMEIPVLVRSLKSSILSSTSFQMGKLSGEWWVLL